MRRGPSTTGPTRTPCEYVENRLDGARIDLWDGGAAPLILCESRSLAGVLRSIAGTYLAPIAATNGQTGGFLHTDVGPWAERAHGDDVPVRVLYLGDLDLSGGHIEENTRKVLEGYADLDWQRVAITEEQVAERRLTKVEKKDNRYKPARLYPAVETEALKQTEIQRILRQSLDALAPSPLPEARKAEEQQRVLVREALAPLHDNGHALANPANIPGWVVAHLVQGISGEIMTGAARLLRDATPRQRGWLERELRHRVARELLRD